ncbi:MAG: DUF475 domain-containing protein [Candidatus Saccharibacteria bacterium]
MVGLLKQYWLVIFISVAAWVAVWWYLGFAAFVVTVILSILEITLSADNAVVNSRVLVKLSPFWQRLFLTVGILIAVFAVRFALPIVMVAIATALDFSSVLSLAISNPTEYGHKLHDVAPIIDGFGGMFLFMVALFFFIDAKRSDRWLKLPENFGAKLAKVRFIKLLLTTLAFATVLLVAPEGNKVTVGVAAFLGAAVYSLLYGVTVLMERANQKKALTQQVGWAAFSLFMYLQVLDASFSLDGVVGAFALSSNIFIIMAGLGVGALWVRTMTIYMVHHETLAKYKYLEAGAHWAILCLAAIMCLKLVGIELPEVVIGSVGLVFIAGSLFGSVRSNTARK